VGHIARKRTTAMGGLKMLDIVKERVSTLPAERRKELIALARDVEDSTVGGVKLVGMNARYHAGSKIVRAAWSRAFPNATAWMSDIPGASAIGDIERLWEGPANYLGEHIASGAISGSRYGVLAKRDPGLWHFAAALRNVKEPELESLYTSPQAKRFVDSVRDYGISGNRSNEIFKLPDDELSQIAGRVSRLTNTPLNVGAIQKELALQNVFSVEGLIEAGYNIRGAQNEGY
jgi:hypothetical protein